MKEFASVEMRRREIDTHKQAQKKRERDTVCTALLVSVHLIVWLYSVISYLVGYKTVYCCACIAPY
jgi:hypothetical protein